VFERGATTELKYEADKLEIYISAPFIAAFGRPGAVGPSSVVV
jgi:hypothetical protein